MGFRARVTAAVVGYLSSSPGVGTARYDFNDSTEIGLSLGINAGQSDSVFTQAFTIAASGTLELDLAGGGLLTALGAPANFAAVKVIKIDAADGNANNIVLGGAVANPFVGFFADATDKAIVTPGGIFLAVDPTAAGRAVTPATADKLLLANSGAGTAVSGTITIIGEAA